MGGTQVCDVNGRALSVIEWINGMRTFLIV
jgi:hypothetical protein